VYPEVPPWTFEKLYEPSDAVFADALVWLFNFNANVTPLRGVPVLLLTIPDIVYFVGTDTRNVLGEAAPFANWVIWKLPALP